MNICSKLWTYAQNYEHLDQNYEHLDQNYEYLDQN